MAQNTAGLKRMKVIATVVDENRKPIFSNKEINCIASWPLMALCQMIERKYDSETHYLDLFCLMKTACPGTPLDYNEPVSRYFKDNDRVMGFGELTKIIPPIPDDKKIPVTVVTGFLGSGKTTLVNYILNEQKDHKFFVIQNEFGAVSIDDDLVRDEMAEKQAENIITLDNGCICCTIRGDLKSAFMKLLKEDYDIEAVIVETTGMANPGPVVGTFLQIPDIQKKMRLDCIVTVVAADHIIDHLEGKKLPEQSIKQHEDNTKRIKDLQDKGMIAKNEPLAEAIEQVLAADRIILNKLDLVKPSEIANIRNTLRGLNVLARILPATKSRIDLKQILNVQAFNKSKIADLDELVEKYQDEDHEKNEHGDDDHDHGHGHGKGQHSHDDGSKQDHSHSHSHGDKKEHSHGDGKADHSHGDTEEHSHGDKGSHSHADGKADHSHGDNEHGDDHEHGHSHGGQHGHSHGQGGEFKHSSGISSIGYKIPGEVIFNKFGEFFQNLSKNGLYRCKGILKVVGQEKKFVFHGVQDNMDYEFSSHVWPKDTKEYTNKVVFIGRNLDKKKIEADFRACLATADDK